MKTPYHMGVAEIAGGMLYAVPIFIRNLVMATGLTGKHIQEPIHFLCGIVMRQPDTHHAAGGF